VFGQRSLLTTRAGRSVCAVTGQAAVRQTRRAARTRRADFAPTRRLGPGAPGRSLRDDDRRHTGGGNPRRDLVRSGDRIVPTDGRPAVGDEHQKRIELLLAHAASRSGTVALIESWRGRPVARLQGCQIAAVSSSNAAATRSLPPTSVPSSSWPRRRFWMNA